MSDLLPRFYLLAPPGPDVPLLDELVRTADVAAVLVTVPADDPRTTVNRIKALAGPVQDAGAALIVRLPGGAEAAGAAMRGGADGLHVDGPAALRGARDDWPRDRILGVGGLRTRDDAMSAGETGADYLLFGEPRPDGFVPPLAGTAERAGWWAEIFETPCVAYAADADTLPVLAGTGAEFVALGPWLWADGRGPVAALAEAARRLAAAAQGVRA